MAGCTPAMSVDSIKMVTSTTTINRIAFSINRITHLIPSTRVMIFSTGTLSIIDRRKNMFKLSQGEYVAIEKVEQTYQKSPVVGQIWAYGNSFKSFILAVVVPTAEPTAAWLYSKGWWPKSDKESTKLSSASFLTDYVTVMEDPAHKAEIKSWVFDQLKSQEKSLTSFTRIRDIIVESGIDKLGMAFTEATDTMTPTFKMKRPQLLQRYIKQLKELYAANGEPGEERWPGEA
jgi:long-chain acyl-CoA synthetase